MCGIGTRMKGDKKISQIDISVHNLGVVYCV